MPSGDSMAPVWIATASQGLMWALKIPFSLVYLEREKTSGRNEVGCHEADLRGTRAVLPYEVELSVYHVTIKAIGESIWERIRPVVIAVVDRHIPKPVCIEETSPLAHWDRRIWKRNLDTPRSKARVSFLGVYTFVTGVALATLFRNPTIPRIACHRCWQYQPFAPPFSEHVPTPEDVY